MEILAAVLGFLVALLIADHIVATRVPNRLPAGLRYHTYRCIRLTYEYSDAQRTTKADAEWFVVIDDLPSDLVALVQLRHNVKRRHILRANLIADEWCSFSEMRRLK